MLNPQFQIQRIVQESLTNVAKHTQATKVKVVVPC
jgi:signal transduction histidine kinase